MSLELSSAWWPASRPIAPLDAVRAAIEALEAGEPVPPAAAKLLAGALRTYLEGGEADIAKSLGLRPRRGGRFDKPAERERLDRRNLLIARVFAAQAGRSDKQRAKAVLALLRVPDPAKAVSDSEVAAALQQLHEFGASELPGSWERIQRVVRNGT